MDVSMELASSMIPGYTNTLINSIFDIHYVYRVDISRRFGPKGDGGKLTSVRVKIERSFIWYKLNTRLEIPFCLGSPPSMNDNNACVYKVLSRVLHILYYPILAIMKPSGVEYLRLHQFTWCVSTQDHMGAHIYDLRRFIERKNRRMRNAASG